VNDGAFFLNFGLLFFKTVSFLLLDSSEEEDDDVEEDDIGCFWSCKLLARSIDLADESIVVSTV